MMNAQAGVRRQFAQAGHRLRCFDHPACRLHCRKVPFCRAVLPGLAAHAGAKAGLFGLLASGIEIDVVASRQAGCARRAAINSRRIHRIDETAVGGGVARRDGGPALVWRRKKSSVRHVQSVPMAIKNAYPCTYFSEPATARTPVLAFKFNIPARRSGNRRVNRKNRLRRPGATTPLRCIFACINSNDDAKKA